MISKNTPLEKDNFSKSFMYSVHELYFLVQKRLETLLAKNKKLSFSQFLILVGFQCEEKGPVSQSSIAERLHLTEATVSRHISTLVTLGYLLKKEDKDNRRKHSIFITKKGEQEFQKASQLIDAELQNIFTIINIKDRALIMKNFSNVLNSLLTKK
jgi:DNA-binding MarR family transcriptional regulator